MYASNPGFSFFVDLILLCGLFAALLAPLGSMIFERGEGGVGEGKKGAGRKFGAILGIILGASAAFALRAAGITLFQYWLTTVASAALLGAVLFVMLKKLHVPPLVAGLICALLAWMIMDSWFVTSNSETVRNLFGFLSLLAPILIFLFILWLFLPKLRGAPEPRPTPPEPRPPEPPEPVPPEPVPPEPVPPVPPGPVPPVPPNPGERLGQDINNINVNVNSASNATNDIDIRNANILQALNLAIADAENAIKSAEQGDSKNTEAHITDLIVRIESIIKAIQGQKTAIAKIMGLKAAIEAILKKYYSEIRTTMVQYGQMVEAIEKEVKTFAGRPEQAELLVKLALLKRDLQILENSLKQLNDIILRLEKHLLVLKDAQLQSLYDDAIKSINEVDINAMKNSIRAFIRKEGAARTPEEAEALRREVIQLIEWLENKLGQITAKCQAFTAASTFNTAQVKEIQAEIKHWKEIFEGLVKKALDAVESGILALQAAINERRAAIAGRVAVPPAARVQAPVPARRRAPAPVQPPAAVVLVPEIDEIIRNIDKQRRLLASLAAQTRDVINRIVFAESVKRKSGQKTIDAKSEQAFLDAIQKAVEEARFDIDAASVSQRIINEIHTAAEHVHTRLMMQNSPAESRTLRELEQNLKTFEKYEQTAVLPVLVNLQETINKEVIETLRKKKTVMVSGQIITDAVKNKLLRLADQLDAAINALAGITVLRRPMPPVRPAQI
jgi:phosphate/sulfate permease